MAELVIVSDSSDCEIFECKAKKEKVVILSDDDNQIKICKSGKKMDPNAASVSVEKCNKHPRKKCATVKKKPATKRKSCEGNRDSKISKKKCRTSVGECSKPVDKRGKSMEKKKTKKEVLELEIDNKPGDAKLLEKAEDVKESKVSKRPKSTSADELAMTWNDAELVADMQNINLIEAQHIVNLLDSDNTIPFIARYRKELTGHMEPEKLRQVKNCYEHVKNIKHKANSAISSIAKLGKLTPELERNLRCSRTFNEIEHIYAPFKSNKIRPLAERGRLLGLGDAAEAILHGSALVVPSNYVQPEVKGLATIQDVITGIQNIVVDIMSKDEELLCFLRNLRKELFIMMECSKAKSVKQRTTVKGGKILTAKQATQMKRKALADAEDKFINYYNFSCNVNHLKPHQVLAINRGENLKILSVKLHMPNYVLNRLSDVCTKRWGCTGLMYPFRDVVLRQSIKDAYNRFLLPLLTRQIRSELLHNAEHAAIEVFASNLKSLLMVPPVRGKKILAIDPGFKNGCKVALISATGNVLETSVIYPINTFGELHDTSLSDLKLKHLLLKYECQEIALGNGTACREVEEYLSSLIKRNWFRPLDVTYSIVSEQGASIYSCSPEAKKEFPNMDPNLISAVSLARRLQDPLVELVKIEPKHLGVGMYQHDLPEKQLSATLDEVVSECTSFVGVDINTASECILRRIAGLTSTKASHIIEHRNTHGLFQNRSQLRDVKSIGNKTFEQCAGFVRINPESFSGRQFDLNPLDQTCIHPESYQLAHRVIEKCGLSIHHLGQIQFRAKVSEVVERMGTEALAAELEVPETQVQLICETFQKPLNYDERSNYQTPLFRREFKSFESLTVNSILTGCVQNVTHFGVFVDVGVGRSGLIHSSRLRKMTPQNGQRVEVLVKSVNLERKRIGLELVRIL